MINSIILEDVEVQAHTVIINSLVGWNAKIGPWCRIEGNLSTDDRSKLIQGIKFYVSVIGRGVAVEPEVMIRNCMIMPFIKVNSNCTNRIIF